MRRDTPQVAESDDTDMWTEAIEHNGWWELPDWREIVAAWKAAGWGDWEAYEWTVEYHVGWRAAKAWARYPRAAKAMCDAGFAHVRDASKWCDASDLGPYDLDGWVAVGVTDPEKVRSLVSAKVTPQEYATMPREAVDILLGLTATDLRSTD